jgi:hypothetical protein
VGSHKTWSRVFRPFLPPKYLDYNSLPDYASWHATTIELKHYEIGMAWRKALRCFWMLHLCNKAILVWSNWLDLAGKYSSRAGHAILLSGVVVSYGFRGLNHAYGSRGYYGFCRGILFMASSMVTVVLGSFDLFVQDAFSAQLVIDVLISVLGLCYGAVYIRKEWQSFGSNGFSPCSNSVPVRRSGILAFV